MVGLNFDRMLGPGWLGGALVAASLWLGGAGVMALPSQSSPLVAASRQTHGYNNLFTIDFPTDWQVSQQTQAPQVTALAPSGGVRTEITWHDRPPAEVVPAALQAIETKGYNVAGYDAINIDNTTALRVWLTNLPEDLPNALMSYIGYPSHTAVIVTYYNGQSTDVDNLISSIHQSFQRLP
ncbi:MAG: hypothetical protein VKL98_02895 [Cyanobacteriota bacterium]|nr:hypothetical protein [Cyanobacteriota bacterium]